MVKIRLTKIGRKKRPYYRIVAIDARRKRDGAYIEQLGTYDPFINKVNLNEQAVLMWLKKGACPSDTVKGFLQKQHIWQEFMN